MIKSIQALPPEIWETIFDFSNLKALGRLAQTNKKIGALASIELKKIIANANTLYTCFCDIQSRYIIKYRNAGNPAININELGKCVLVELNIYNRLICIKELKNVAADSENLDSNQVMVVPNFDHIQIREFLAENNPNFFLGLGMETMACSIAQDRLPIKKITVKTKLSHATLLMAVNIATYEANRQFLRLNGSFLERLDSLLDRFKDWLSYPA